MRKIILTLTALLAIATPLALSVFTADAAMAVTVITPRQSYGDWIGGRHAGRLNYRIDSEPNANMTRTGRALWINAHTDRQIHYKAVLGTGAQCRVMTGWVGGHGPKSVGRLPHSDYFWGLRRGETYSTIRVFRIA